jgi:hypothetical protein
VRHDFASSDHPLPVFLSSRTEQYEEPKTSSWLRRISLFVMAIGVIGAAMTLSLGNPMNILGLASNSPAPPATDPSASSTVASNDDAQDTKQASPQQTSPQQAAPPTVSPQTAAALAALAAALPARDAAPSAAASSPPSESQAGDPPGALLKQFQSWAATQDTQPAQDTQRQTDQVRPIVQEAQPQAEPPRPVQQAARPDAADDTPAPAPIMRASAPKHHKPRPVQNARAEIRAAKPPQAGARPLDRTARADARPADRNARAPQDGRPAEQAPQPQTPSFLQSIGIRPQQ